MPVVKPPDLGPLGAPGEGTGTQKYAITVVVSGGSIVGVWTGSGTIPPSPSDPAYALIEVSAAEYDLAITRLPNTGLPAYRYDSVSRTLVPVTDTRAAFNFSVSSIDANVEDVVTVTLTRTDGVLVGTSIIRFGKTPVRVTWLAGAAVLTVDTSYPYVASYAGGEDYSVGRALNVRVTATKLSE